MPSSPRCEVLFSVCAEAIKAASSRTRFVLPAPLGVDSVTGLYVLESDIFAGVDFDPASVRRGYIALPRDLRQIPYLPVKDGAVESFSQAIARSFSEQALKYLPEFESLPYGSYIRRKEFDTLSAGRLLSGSTDLRVLAHKIVLVGGNWSRFAYGLGGETDSYFTPIGFVPGVFIHANYAEALLDSRTYSPLGERVQLGLEIRLSRIHCTV